MSDINLDFTVSNNSIDFTVQPNDITITPTDVQLTFNANFQPLAGGSPFQLQFNNTGVLGGVANSSYTSGNLTLGDVANIKITGGTNGYVLQTDGTGNLDWTAMTGGGGNGSPGGSNTQIQYNDNGTFGGNSGFTFNEVSGNVNIPGNLSVVGNISGSFIAPTANFANFAGNVTVASQSNITSLGTLTSLSVSGNIGTTGTTSIQQALEKVTVNVSAATSTINFDLNTQAILYYTSNATGNFTLNFRGNSSLTLNSMLSNNQSITCAFINTNGATAYYANVIAIDGTTITPKYVYPGQVTTGTISGADVYTFNIIKTATNTYSVFASKIGYV
jgi:hypothetical protein